jgi:hypothetical protein
MMIRNWERTGLGLVAVAAFIGFIAYGEVTDPAADTVAGVAVAVALLLVLLVRVWRAGALVTADRLVVRNVFRDYPLPWSEVAAFSPADDDQRHHMFGVTAADGRRIACAALRPMAGWSIIGPPKFAEYNARSTAAARLAAEIERHTAPAHHRIDDRSPSHPAPSRRLPK